MMSRLLTGTDEAELIKQAFSLWERELAEKVFNLEAMKISNYYAHNCPDVYLLPEDITASSIGVETVRNLVKQLATYPIQKSIKLVVIHRAHLLTPEAQNALLKILEEPPDFALLVLTSTHPEALLETVLSRVVRIKVESRKSMSPAEKENIIINNRLLANLLQTEPALRLVRTAELAKDREAAKQLVGDLFNYFQQGLAASPVNKSANQVIDNRQLLVIFSLLRKSLQYLEANTHPQLTIDHLFLHLPLTGNQSLKPV